MSDSQLSGLLQENLLALLAFDNNQAVVIRGLVPVECFEGLYREIARGVYNYIDTQHAAPNMHLPDLFDDVLEGSSSKARQYQKIIGALKRTYRECNAEYIMRRLGQFVRHQRLKSATMDLMEVFSKDEVNESELDRVENILSDSLRTKIEVLEPGISLGNKKTSLGFLDAESHEVFPTGVSVLDHYQLGPARKTLHMLQGLRKAGKTHWLVSLGKQSYKMGHKVLHVSLEMDEQQMAQRYYQALFAFSKRKEEDEEDGFYRTRFRLNETNQLIGLSRRRIHPKFTLSDRDARRQLIKRIDRHGIRLDRILIKSFPSGTLTMNALRAYLDRLEIQEGFIPDLLIIDYPQIMKLSASNFRLEFGRITVELRGLCHERNMAGATVLQSNQKGGVAEDFSQTMTADTVIKYEQNQFEARHQLARLWVEAARFERDKFGILISQNYGLGQFCYQSILMRPSYDDIIAKKEQKTARAKRKKAVRRPRAKKAAAKKIPQRGRGRRT